MSLYRRVLFERFHCNTLGGGGGGVLLLSCIMFIHYMIFKWEILRGTFLLELSELFSIQELGTKPIAIFQHLVY